MNFLVYFVDDPSRYAYVDEAAAERAAAEYVAQHESLLAPGRDVMARAPSGKYWIFRPSGPHGRRMVSVAEFSPRTDEPRRDCGQTKDDYNALAHDLAGRAQGGEPCEMCRERGQPWPDVGPAHDCGGFALVRFRNEWTLRDYYAEGRLVFCPTCGKRLPLEA